VAIGVKVPRITLTTTSARISAIDRAKTRSLAAAWTTSSSDLDGVGSVVLEVRRFTLVRLAEGALGRRGTMSTKQLKVTGINHVVLHVGDVDRAVEFYKGVLGFVDRDISPRLERRMRFLRCGMQGLDLFEVEGDVHGGQEMNHMALNVEASDVDEMVAALQAAGISVSERTRRNSVFIHDPDGHQIEMLPLNALEREREKAGATAAH
jgi:catechol 2,3-dioxygenase-like lactoylglutathione lyase family enzyme